MCKSKKVYVVSVFIPLIVGWLRTVLGMSGIAEYEQFIKPPLAPPGFIFGIVWSVLYVLMGIGSALIYCAKGAERDSAIGVYAVQLIVNLLWVVFFFVFRWRLFSFFWILLLIGLVIMMIWQFCRVHKTAGYLQIPYLLWVLFAGYLNLSIWYLN